MAHSPYLQQPEHGEVVIYQDQPLGIGAYGKVCKARCGQLPCAAKLLHDTLFQHNDPGEQVLMGKFKRECLFLSTIKHPNIVQYIATTTDPGTGRAVLLMELMDESLTKHLKRSVTPLPFHIQVDICHDVVLALAYLHSNGVVHRDLSSNNVLLIAGRRAKVTDFGMSKLIDAYQCPQMTPLTQAPGTQHYMPPEALITPPRYTEKLDCFSYGVLALQIASGNYPTPGEAHMYEQNPNFPTGRVIVVVPEEERRADDIAQVDPHNPIRPIALHCIKDIDTQRPTASDLCDWVARLKEQRVYKESIKAGEGNSPKYYIELQRVDKELSELKRELVKSEESRRHLLGELNSEKQSVVHYQAVAREANRKQDMAEQEVGEVYRKLRRVEQDVASGRVGDGELVRKLERREKGLAQLLADVRKKLGLTEQQLFESQGRERELQERLYAVGKEYREKDAERVHIQQTALGYKEYEVEHLRKKVKEYEGILSDFQVMDLNKEQQAALRQYENVRATQQLRQYELSPTLQPTLNPPIPKASTPTASESAPQQLAARVAAVDPPRKAFIPGPQQSAVPQQQPVIPPHQPAAGFPPQQLVPPIPQWREAKPPPEEMTGYTGQVTVHEGIAYFTQNFVVYAYIESCDKWEELPRCENKHFGVAMINGKLTAIGGLDRNKIHTNDLLTLKKLEKKWEKLLPVMPTARVHPATVTIPTHLIVAGGTYVSDDPNRSLKGYAIVELMALGTFLWSAVSSLPEVVRYPQIKHTAKHLLLSDTENSSVYTCLVDELVQSQQGGVVWERKAKVPVQDGASLVNFEDQVLALGGKNGAGVPQDSIYRYKVTEDEWELVKDLRTPRSWVLSVLCRNNVLVVVGGFEGRWAPCHKTEKITLKL